MVKDTTLYDRLEVSENASNNEIMKSYKKLAIKNHPDKNPDDPNASVKLQELNQAKEILLDSEKRKMYDQIGMDYVNGNVPQQAGINPEDLFNMFGGGGFPGGGFPFQNMRKQQQKENVVINQEVSLEDIYNEATIGVTFNQKQLCTQCKGEGSKDGRPTKCGTCDGRGVRVQVVQMGPMIQQIQSGCNVCNGSGRVADPSNRCNLCNGEGNKSKEVRINFPLKNGLSNGQQIQIPGHGHHLKDGKTDLVVVIKEKPHPRFKRINNDLCVEVELKLFQAIFGFDKVIEHLDKRQLYISQTGKTEYGSLKRIPGEGMKILNGNNNKGDLIIKFKIKLPSLDNAENANKLLYLLRTLDQDEANNETKIKGSKSNYIKTIMLNTDIDPFTNPQNTNSPQQDEGPQQQQCVHQ
jgi:DnaJ family protein A protein 2